MREVIINIPNRRGASYDKITVVKANPIKVIIKPYKVVISLYLERKIIIILDTT